VLVLKRHRAEAEQVKKALLRLRAP